MSDLLSYARTAVGSVGGYLTHASSSSPPLPPPPPPLSSSLPPIPSSSFLSFPTSSSSSLSSSSHDLSRALALLEAKTTFAPPKMVVVGTQSSGKSSMLNALMGVDVLPVGETMTTRGATRVELSTSAPGSSPRVEVGWYDEGGGWREDFCQEIGTSPSEATTARVRSAVASHACAHLLSPNGVTGTTRCSVVRLFSPQVPNLCFVDLPGVTMTALTSEGQPADLCQQIRDLVASHVDERTVVLLVCPARADLEADPAMELCRSLTAGGRRTVGCLTKPDLCEGDFEKYLSEETVPPDLALEHGYFVVHCKGGGGGARAAYEAEAAHFSARPLRSRSPSVLRRVGLGRLAAALLEVHERNVRSHAPALRAELEEGRAADLQTLRRVRGEWGGARGRSGAVVGERGSGQGDGGDDPLGTARDVLSEFCQTVRQTVTEKRPDAGCARRVKGHLTSLHERLLGASHFPDLEDEEIRTAVRNSEGWGMQSPVPPVDIVEFFVQHPVHQPVRRLLGPCMLCVEGVLQEVKAATRAAAEDVARQFPVFCDWLVEWAGKEVEEEGEELRRNVRFLLLSEEAYVYTDDPTFLKEWASAVGRCPSDSSSFPSSVRAILRSYLRVVASTVASVVPKFVVHGLRRRVDDLRPSLGDRLRASFDPATFLALSAEAEADEKRALLSLRAAEDCLRALEHVPPPLPPPPLPSSPSRLPPPPPP